MTTKPQQLLNDFNELYISVKGFRTLYRNATGVTIKHAQVHELLTNAGFIKLNVTDIRLDIEANSRLRNGYISPLGQEQGLRATTGAKALRETVEAYNLKAIKEALTHQALTEALTQESAVLDFQLALADLEDIITSLSAPVETPVETPVEPVELFEETLEEKNQYIAYLEHQLYQAEQALSLIKELATEPSESYDAEGYDINGYNREGFDSNGFDSNGYDINGYNEIGYDIEGFDSDNLSHLCIPKECYINGYDKDGYDTEGYDREGYSTAGYNFEGYNRDGYASNGQHITEW